MKKVATPVYIIPDDRALYALTLHLFGDAAAEKLRRHPNYEQMRLDVARKLKLARKAP